MPPENTIPDVSPAAASSSGEPAQSVPESPAPIVETPAQEVPPAVATPETPPIPTEATSTPETDQPSVQTAQIPPNEPFDPAHDKPLPQKVDPFDSVQSKPTPAPEPPSSAASIPAPVIQQTGILRSAREILVKARVALQDRKRKKRDKIMEALGKKTKITNDEVEKLLHISDATAARYLLVLVKEGKIRKVGTTGRGVTYEKV